MKQDRKVCVNVKERADVEHVFLPDQRFLSNTKLPILPTNSLYRAEKASENDSFEEVFQNF